MPALAAEHVLRDVPAMQSPKALSITRLTRISAAAAVLALPVVRWRQSPRINFKIKHLTYFKVHNALKRNERLCSNLLFGRSFFDIIHLQAQKNCAIL